MGAKNLCSGADTEHAPNLMDRCSIGANSIPQYVTSHIEIDKFRRNPTVLILGYLDGSDDGLEYSIRNVGGIPSAVKPTKLAERIALSIDNSCIEFTLRGIVNHASDAEDITKQIVSANPPF